MKKNLLFICEIAVFSSLAIVLDYVCGLIKIGPNGGSINIAMLPILIVSYRWKAKGGLISGLLVGTIQLIWASSIINPIQAILDYVLSYTVIGLSGLFYHNIDNLKKFKKNLILIIGAIISILIRLCIATISGIVFWQTPFTASLIYNISYLLPSGAICIVLLIILINVLSYYIEKKKA